MSRFEPLRLQSPTPTAYRETLFENFCRNRAGHTASMQPTLDHGDHHIFRLIKRSETGKPCDRFLFPAFTGLSGPRFSSNHHSFEPRR